MTNYIPILNVRPSELIAMTEVPDIAKEEMLPIFRIRPWLGRGPLSRATGRILQSFRSRSWIAELDASYDGEHEDYIDEMNALRDPAGYYVNWKNFVDQLPHAIPAAIVSPFSDDFGNQIRNLLELGRGAAIRFDRSVDSDIIPYLNSLQDIDSSLITIVLDYGQFDERLLGKVIPAVHDCRFVIEALPDARIAVSATTFPSSFDDLRDEAIYERRFHANVMRETPSNSIIYSDHGSARFGDERGGGVPRPRIDLPTEQDWHFFRSDLVREKDMTREKYLQLRDEEYQRMAGRAISSRYWDRNFNIWGTQYIKITQLGSEWGINSPAKATACRINIHLTRQALYGANLSGQDFEEDWED